MRMYFITAAAVAFNLQLCYSVVMQTRLENNQTSYIAHNESSTRVQDRCQVFNCRKHCLLGQTNREECQTCECTQIQKNVTIVSRKPYGKSKRPCKKRKCKGLCVNGNEKNKRGCLTCRCKRSHSSHLLLSEKFEREAHCKKMSCLPCKFGYIINSMGCPTCECLTDISAKDDTHLSCLRFKCRVCTFGYAYDSKGCQTCTCLPEFPAISCQIRKCASCPAGLDTYDKYGCKLCFCKKFRDILSGFSQLKDTTNMTRPLCPFVQCHEYCPDEKMFLRDSKGCKTCNCAQERNMSTTTIYTDNHSTERKTDTDCIHRSNKRKGIFYSPGWPTNYPNATSCTYEIILPNRKHKRFLVDMEYNFNGTFPDGFTIQDHLFGNAYADKRLKFMTYEKKFKFSFNSTPYSIGRPFTIWFSYRKSKRCPGTALTCPISCIFGQQRDKFGCLTCQCADTAETTTTMHTTQMIRRKPKNIHHNLEEDLSRKDIKKSDLIHYLESLSAVSKRIIQEVKFMKSKSIAMAKMLQKNTILN